VTDQVTNYALVAQTSESTVVAEYVADLNRPTA